MVCQLAFFGLRVSDWRPDKHYWPKLTLRMCAERSICLQNTHSFQVHVDIRQVESMGWTLNHLKALIWRKILGRWEYNSSVSELSRKNRMTRQQNQKFTHSYKMRCIHSPRAVSSHHKHSSLRWQSLFSPFWRLDAQNQGFRWAMLPLQALGKNRSLPLAGFWWLSAVLGVPWLVAA